MENQTISSGTVPKLRKRSQLTPHRLALTIVWLLATGTFVAMLTSGVRNTGRFRVERNILHAAYVWALFWYLGRRGPSVKQLPEIHPLLLKRWRVGRLIPALVIAFIFVITFFGVAGIIRPLLMIAAPLILVIWRREIQLRSIVQGLALAIIAYLAGLPFLQSGYLNQPTFVLLLIYLPPLFVAGGLLLKRTGLGGSQLYAGQYRKAVVSFLWGCLLFIPLGLANAAAGSPGPWMTWVTRWWIPFTQPLFSGIQEEAFFRLCLVSLCYLLLRPAFSKCPAVAVVCALLFSAITFGLGHGGTLLDRFLMTGLLYGLPMAVIFARRDYEHAVGAHYMINMIPTLMVFLGT